MAWYTFKWTSSTAAGAQLSPQVAFERLWTTALFRSREACLLAGGSGPLGTRHYLALPEGAEDLISDFLRSLRTEPLHGVPDDIEVKVLVGNEARAMELWEERITCSRENPGACVMCGA